MLVQSFCCCPVAKSCLTLCNPQEVDSSTPGSSVVHHLPEFSQIHVHWVSDATQTSHPLSSPSPPALSLSWHQSFPMNPLFASRGQSIEAPTSASVLPMNIQGWFPLGLIGWISLQSKGLSRVLSSTTVWFWSILWFSAFFMVQLSHPYMTSGNKHRFDYIDLCQQSDVCFLLSIL